MLKLLISYPEGFKKRLVKQIELGQIGVEEARRKYGIGGTTTISKWRKKYRSCDIKSLRITKQMKKKIVLDPAEKRIKELEKRIFLYKTLIEESDYFRDPAIKKKIAERLSAKFGKDFQKLRESDIPYLISVLPLESADKDITNMKKEKEEGSGEKKG